MLQKRKLKFKKIGLLKSKVHIGKPYNFRLEGLQIKKNLPKLLQKTAKGHGHLVSLTKWPCPGLASWPGLMIIWSQNRPGFVAAKCHNTWEVSERLFVASRLPKFVEAKDYSNISYINQLMCGILVLYRSMCYPTNPRKHTFTLLLKYA